MNKFANDYRNCRIWVVTGSATYDEDSRKWVPPKNPELRIPDAKWSGCIRFNKIGEVPRTLSDGSGDLSLHGGINFENCYLEGKTIEFKL